MWTLAGSEVVPPLSSCFDCSVDDLPLPEAQPHPLECLKADMSQGLYFLPPPPTRHGLYFK